MSDNVLGFAAEFQDNASPAMGKLGLSYAALEAKVNKFDAMVQKNTKTLQAISLGAGIAATGLGFASNRMWKALGDSTNKAEEWEKSTTNLKYALGDINEIDFSKLKGRMMDVGMATLYSAKDASDSMYQLVSYGLGTSVDILDKYGQKINRTRAELATDDVLRFSTMSGGLISLADSAAFTGAMINKLNIDMSKVKYDEQGNRVTQLTRAMDMLAMASVATAIQIEDIPPMFNSMRTAMGDMNMPLETGLAWMGTFKNMGMQAAETGNMMVAMGRKITMLSGKELTSKMMQELGGGGNRGKRSEYWVNKVFGSPEELNKQLKDAKGNFGNMTQFIGKIIDYTDKAYAGNKVGKLAFLKNFFGDQQSMQGVQMLASASAKVEKDIFKVDEWGEKLKDAQGNMIKLYSAGQVVKGVEAIEYMTAQIRMSQGEAQRYSKMMEGTLWGVRELKKGVVETFQILMGEHILPIAKAALLATKTVFEQLVGFARAHPYITKVAVVLGIVVAVLLTVGTAAAGLIALVTFMITQFQGLGRGVLSLSGFFRGLKASTDAAALSQARLNAAQRAMPGTTALATRGAPVAAGRAPRLGGAGSMLVSAGVMVGSSMLLNRMMKPKDGEEETPEMAASRQKKAAIGGVAVMGAQIGVDHMLMKGIGPIKMFTNMFTKLGSIATKTFTLIGNKIPIGSLMKGEGLIAKIGLNLGTWGTKLSPLLSKLPVIGALLSIATGITGLFTNNVWGLGDAFRVVRDKIHAYVLRPLMAIQSFIHKFVAGTRFLLMALFTDEVLEKDVKTLGSSALGLIDFLNSGVGRFIRSIVVGFRQVGDFIDKIKVIWEGFNNSKGLTEGMGEMGAIFGGIGTLIGMALGGPLGAIVGGLVGTAIGALIAGIVNIVRNWDDFKKRIGETMQLIGGAFMAKIEGIKNFFINVASAIWGALVGAFNKVRDAIVGTFDFIRAKVAESPFGRLILAVVRAIGFIHDLGFFAGQMVGMLAAGLAVGIGNLTVKAAKATANFLVNVGKGIANFAVSGWKTISGLAVKGAGFVVNVFSKAKDSAISFVTGALGEFSKFFGNIWQLASSSPFGQWIGGILNTVRNIFTGIISSAMSLGSTIASTISSGLKTAWDVVVDWVNKLRDKIASIFDGLGATINSLVSKGYSAMANLSPTEGGKDKNMSKAAEAAISGMGSPSIAGDYFGNGVNRQEVASMLAAARVDTTGGTGNKVMHIHLPNIPQGVSKDDIESAIRQHLGRQGLSQYFNEFVVEVNE